MRITRHKNPDGSEVTTVELDEPLPRISNLDELLPRSAVEAGRERSGWNSERIRQLTQQLDEALAHIGLFARGFASKDELKAAKKFLAQFPASPGRTPTESEADPCQT